MNLFCYPFPKAKLMTLFGDGCETGNVGEGRHSPVVTWVGRTNTVKTCSRTGAAPGTQGVTTHTRADGCFNIINSTETRTIEKLRISKALKHSEFSLMEISVGFSNVRRHPGPSPDDYIRASAWAIRRHHMPPGFTVTHFTRWNH